MRDLPGEPPGTLLICATSVDDDRAPASGLVRGTIGRGGFLLRPAGDGETDVTMVAAVDPGGAIPAFIAEQAAAIQYENMARIKAAAEEETRGGQP